MLTAASFFDLSSWAHPDLIQAGAEPWAALKSLKGYLAARNYPEFPPGLIRDREPLRQTLVFYDNSFLETEGLVLECGDTTKGGVKVYDGDKQLVGVLTERNFTAIAGQLLEQKLREADAESMRLNRSDVLEALRESPATPRLVSDSTDESAPLLSRIPGTRPSNGG